MSATVTHHPVGRNPEYGTGEYNSVSIRGADTIVIAARGGGFIHTVVPGVAGTLAIFYDTPSGGTTDDTTKILELDLASLPNGIAHDIGVSFARGLVLVLTGASAELTVTGRWGRATRTVLRALPHPTL